MGTVVENWSLLIGLVTGIVVYLWVYRWLQRNRVGPKEWPIFGCFFEAKRNSHRQHDWFDGYLQKTPSGILVTQFWKVNLVQVANAAAVEQILKTNFPNYIKGPLLYERTSDLLGDGIFATDGETWKQHRKISSFEFSSIKLRNSSACAYREHALRLAVFLDKVADTEKSVNIQDLFLRMTMDSICMIAFGVDQHSLSEDLPEIPFAAAFDAAQARVTRRIFDLFWKVKRFLNLGEEKAMKAEIKIVDNYVYGVILDRRAELKRLTALNRTLDKEDLLSRFMNGKDKDGNPLSDNVLRDAALNFMVAGRDTSAALLSWWTYELCLNPHVAEKCHEELRDVFGNLESDGGEEKGRYSSFADRCTFDSLSELHYIHATLSECLRLHPPVARDSKYAVNDDVLPDGTKVKAKSMVVYSPYSMGRSETLWGPGARVFRPERWLKDGVYQSESLFKFTAFQAGPRVCLGKENAYLQMKMTAAILMRFFRFHLVPDQTVDYRVSLVMSIRNGLLVTVSKR